MTKKVKNRFGSAEIGSFDDFVSRYFDTIVISHCKTEKTSSTAGPLLNNNLNIQFIKSRATKKIVIIGKS